MSHTHAEIEGEGPVLSQVLSQVLQRAETEVHSLPQSAPNPHCGYSLTVCQVLHHDANVDD